MSGPRPHRAMGKKKEFLQKSQQDKMWWAFTEASALLFLPTNAFSIRIPYSQLQAELDGVLQASGKGAGEVGKADNNNYTRSFFQSVLLS